MKNKKQLLLVATYIHVCASNVHEIYRSTLLRNYPKFNDDYMSLHRSSTTWMYFLGGENAVVNTIRKDDFAHGLKRLVKHMHSFQDLLNQIKPHLSVYDFKHVQNIEVDMLRILTKQTDFNKLNERVCSTLGTFSTQGLLGK
jgi:hypothetical protein